MCSAAGAGYGRSARTVNWRSAVIRLGGLGLSDGLEQVARGVGDLVDRLVERLLVLPRRRPIAADLADELESCGADLFVRGQVVGTAQGNDASAHAEKIANGARSVRGGCEQPGDGLFRYRSLD